MNCDTSMPSHQHSHPNPQAPSVGALPIVLDKADVVQMRIDADRGQRFQVEVLDVRRRRFEDHLKLVVVLQAIRVFAIAAVLRPPRRLHIGGVPRLGTERAQRGRGVKGAGADFHVIGLQDHAAVIRPITLERQDQSLERAFRAHMRGQGIHRRDRSSRGVQARGTVSAGTSGIKAMESPSFETQARARS